MTSRSETAGRCKPRTVIAPLAHLLMAWLLLTAHRADAAGPTTPAIAERFREVGIFQRLGRPLPLEARFLDDAGRPVRLGDYFGRRPVVLLLAYYECPMLCNVALNGLVETLRGLDFNPGREFELLVVSFDPRDTPKLAAAKKRAFQTRYGRRQAERGMHFLTGQPEAIRQLTEAVGFRYFYDERSGQYAHASGIVIATPQGKLSRYFYGIDYPPKDVRLGLVEASDGLIGTPVDQILLLCFHYDPLTGKYGFAIMSALRIGGVLTVVTIVGFIIGSIYRERRAARRRAGTQADLPVPSRSNPALWGEA